MIHLPLQRKYLNITFCTTIYIYNLQVCIFFLPFKISLQVALTNPAKLVHFEPNDGEFQLSAAHSNSRIEAHMLCSQQISTSLFDPLTSGGQGGRNIGLSELFFFSFSCYEYMLWTPLFPLAARLVCWRLVSVTFARKTFLSLCLNQTSTKKTTGSEDPKEGRTNCPHSGKRKSRITSKACPRWWDRPLPRCTTQRLCTSQLSEMKYISRCESVWF